MKVSAQEFRLHDARSDKLGFLAALGAFAITAAICKAATPAGDAREAIWPTQEWQISSPEKEGMDSKKLAKLVDFGTVHSFDSLLVTRHGKIVAEAYYAPYAAGILHATNSITKAVIGTLVGILSEEGVLDNPSHRVLDFFDRAKVDNLDARKEAITIQNLLDMASGLAWDQPPYGEAPSVDQMLQSPDWVKFILDRPMSTAPGITFNYSDGDAHLLSAIITKLTGIKALDYAKEELFGPLGINKTFWPHDPQGISMAGYGLYLEPRDMAKIGYLYLRRGLWEGRQLLPAAWIDRIAQTMSGSVGHSEIQHSNLFWVLPDKHVYMAVGAYRQVIMVFPELDIVTVATARVDNYPLGDWADSISSSVKSNESLPADSAGAKLLADKIHEAANEKPTAVGPTSKMAASISGKVYRFPPNQMGLKSLSLFLTDSQPHYDLETYGHSASESGPRFAGPIGLDGRYRKGEVTYCGFGPLFKGLPSVYALKGAWQDDQTFVIDRMLLGNGSLQIWTLTFDGNTLNIRMQFGALPEISVDGTAGG